MRFICLGYIEEGYWEGLGADGQSAMMEECFAYDDELRKGGHIVGGEALAASSGAVTLRPKAGKVEVTDGPYAETKEQLGGILVLEARDLNHAIALMSKHPGARVGPFEIRAADETTKALFEERNERIKRETR